MANGVASTLDLVEVPKMSAGEPTRLMRREAARQMGALRREFAKEFGSPPYLAETFRSLATQQDYYRTFPKGSAAFPGTSFHGTGDAADMWTGIDKYGTPQHQWMQRNAPAYGFTNTQGKATRSSRYPNGEAHHWVYVGRPAIVAGLNTEEIDMGLSNEDVERVGQNLLNIERENPANGRLTKIGDLIRYGEYAGIARRDEIMARLAQIVEWMDNNLRALGVARDADQDALLEAVRAISPGDTTVLADLSPVIAAIEKLQSTLPEATREALAAALARPSA
ncbi:M15 family metallopeptidase [Clavibacter michiganensis]|uniref:M15 family metallopeptidase n=1 Tax=Clavibacter michiganensis TaxID=28447 RepID=UPI0015E29C83|nr:M15 family metallopeptidase [Clavibacter michiganensis]